MTPSTGQDETHLLVLELLQQRLVLNDAGADVESLQGAGQGLVVDKPEQEFSLLLNSRPF